MKKIKSLNTEINNHIRNVKMTVEECRKLCNENNIEYRNGYENRVIERIVTTEKPDRDGDIIRCKGIDNKNYRLNPVVLYAHDKYSTPVGRSLKEWIDKNILGWKSWDLYLDDDVDTTGQSDLIYRMVSNGIMTGGSIGFIPKVNGIKNNHTDEERKNLGLGKYGIEYLAIEKIEHSVCSVPCNPEALTLSIKSNNNFIKKSDCEIIEKFNLFDKNIIDIFSSVNNKNPIISIPNIQSSIPNNNNTDIITFYKNVESSIQSSIKEGKKEEMVINIDMNKTIQELSEINKKIEEFNTNIKNIELSITEKFKFLMEIADKAITSIKQTENNKSVFDNEIKNLLKF